jgi:hypothetical protein
MAWLPEPLASDLGMYSLAEHRAGMVAIPGPE